MVKELSPAHLKRYWPNGTTKLEAVQSRKLSLLYRTYPLSALDDIWLLIALAQTPQGSLTRPPGNVKYTQSVENGICLSLRMILVCSHGSKQPCIWRHLANTRCYKDCYLQVRPNGADTPLMPSFLSLDLDGRVVRLDSFSKFIAPGSRCGWITGPKELVTTIMVKAEASSVSVKPYDLSISLLIRMTEWTFRFCSCFHLRCDQGMGRPWRAGKGLSSPHLG